MTNKKITGYKGFDRKLQCLNHQYKEGETYEMDGSVKLCSRGFHFCEEPLDVFSYYPPGESRYCEVEGGGTVEDNEGGDSKVAVSRLKVGVEIGIKGMVDAGVKFILDRVSWKKGEHLRVDKTGAQATGNQSAATNTGNQSAATNTGYQSAATNTGNQSAATNTGDQSVATNTGNRSVTTNTGYQSAATNTGYRSVATNTGNQSAATNTGNRSVTTNTGNQSAATNTGNRSVTTNTGDRSAATNTGYQSAATNTGDQSVATNTGYRSVTTNTGNRSAATVGGKESIACGLGIENKAMAALGCWLVLSEWRHDDNYGWHIKFVKSVKVDGIKIKADTWYRLENGRFVRVK